MPMTLGVRRAAGRTAVLVAILALAVACGDGGGATAPDVQQTDDGGFGTEPQATNTPGAPGDDGAGHQIDFVSPCEAIDEADVAEVLADQTLTATTYSPGDQFQGTVEGYRCQYTAAGTMWLQVVVEEGELRDPERRIATEDKDRCELTSGWFGQDSYSTTCTWDGGTVQGRYYAAFENVVLECSASKDNVADVPSFEAALTEFCVGVVEELSA